MALDWTNLPFGYHPTNGVARVDYKDGAWARPTFVRQASIDLHLAANCLHYGQSCFEGLKAFMTVDERIVLFRVKDHARRLRNTAERTCMAAPDEALFIECCKLAIANNLDFVPPYGTGASLYIRPLLIGTEPTIGVRPSTNFSFFVMVTPVGPYYKGFHPVDAVVVTDYDRAAPRGTGHIKLAGNYAAGFYPMAKAKKEGFPIVLYTDAREHRYVEEFGTSNFVGIAEDGSFKTPDSPSILPSVTNQSLQTLAKDLGVRVCCERIPLDSIGAYTEIGACGTAAVITPIGSITWPGGRFQYNLNTLEKGTLSRLYKALQDVQYGRSQDRHSWLLPVAS